MQTTILQFSSLAEMLMYKDYIQAENFEMNLDRLTIAFSCSEDELNEAISNYAVTIVYRSTEGSLKAVI